MSIAASVPASVTVYAPAVPVSLPLTLRTLLRGSGDPTMLIDASGYWRAFRTPLGPGTLHLRQAADGAVHARAWGAGAEWLIAHVPELLGHGDDWSGLDLSEHRPLAEVLRRSTGLRLTRTNLVFEMLAPSILEQKVTSTEAWRAYRALVRLHGEPAPGPIALHVAPSAEQWRRVPSWDWHRAGVDPRRSRTLVTAALVAPGLERTLVLGRGGAEAERRLRSVPGIGPWTASEVMMRAHGDPDAVSVGDYHLASAVGFALTGRLGVDDDGMLELLDPWRGHRQRVIRLIECSGAHRPRRGPRLTIQDHRWH
ncbi:MULTISPECIES: DNA-3-methyladenine glycosylase family protein [unclassified Rathayibacter]|uniref:DNA-3-methyladenine glycosylase family protein n=1 Tax=unclassified Rathayibacter TaxID=2609250 RepID=UPI00188A4499|nr:MULTISPECIES: DNA-3-methyladenine glycosylase 2 family protein [unclassified Rathayibacter]MBF4461442.1 DNA-3-methyladenine glycosylase 2 family protein [Rathayibacter sp. VKM Ac-2879]MBF4502853.1 DNA-3-methyladenine glycosylase 2 family protein [Rathayibacter sp. VKM Ac-2878]